VLLTAEIHYPRALAPPAAWGPLLGIRAGRLILTLPSEERRTERTLPAFVNDGRWVVVCPCGGAQVAARSDRRFFCVDCRGWEGRGWDDVYWPDDEELEVAERLLLARPDPLSRNWRPWDETAEVLYEENLAHGVTG
jgi:hypothetical protein